MAQVRWGVLGTANIAVERVIPAAQRSEVTSVYAIASRNLERAQEAAKSLNVPRAYGDYDELLADEAVDAVYIPLPNDMHLQWTLRALAAGKHVLCEKPLCLTSADVRALIKAQTVSGKYLEEGLAFRNHPQWGRIQAILGSGEIGSPVGAMGTIAKRFLDPADIRNNPLLGGGAAYDLGIYVISACMLAFNRAPQRVIATMDIDPEFGIDRLTTMVLDYGDAHASLMAASQAGTAAWATHQQFSVLGARGWLRCNFPYAQARPSECIIEIGNETSVGALPTRVERFEPTNQYGLQIDRFSRLILGEAVTARPLDHALTATRIIECAFESARAGKWIELGSETQL